MVRQLIVLVSMYLLMSAPGSANTVNATSVSQNASALEKSRTAKPLKRTKPKRPAKPPKPPKPPRRTRPPRPKKTTPPVTASLTMTNSPFFCDGPTPPSHGLYSSASLINIPGVTGQFVNASVNVPAGISIPGGPDAGTVIHILPGAPLQPGLPYPTTPFNSLTIDVLSSSYQTFWVTLIGIDTYGGPNGIVIQSGSDGLTIKPSTNPALAAIGLKTWTMMNANSFYAPLASVSSIRIEQRLSTTPGLGRRPGVHRRAVSISDFGECHTQWTNNSTLSSAGWLH